MVKVPSGYTAPDLLFYDIFAPQKVPFSKISDDVIACGLWFGSPPIKNLVYAYGPNFLSWRPGSTTPFEEILQWWQVVGNTAPDVTGPRFKTQTFRSKDKRITARSKL